MLHVKRGRLSVHCMKLSLVSELTCSRTSTHFPRRTVVLLDADVSGCGVFLDARRSPRATRARSAALHLFTRPQLQLRFSLVLVSASRFCAVWRKRYTRFSRQSRPDQPVGAYLRFAVEKKAVLAEWPRVFHNDRNDDARVLSQQTCPFCCGRSP